MTRRTIWAILIVALLLRVWLAGLGGQGYWPDELMRYGEAQNAAYHVTRGDWQRAVPDLFGRADHQLFRWIALVPALLDTWWGANSWRTACWFSLFSVGCVALIGRIVRAGGGGAREELFAMTAAAVSTTLFIYSRHYLPYDAALFFLLLAFLTGMGPDKGTRSLLTGAWAAAAFLTYNGYWLGVAAVALVHTFGADAWKARVRRGFWMTLGIAIPLGTMLGIGRWLGFDLIALYRANSGTITQGDFGLGWRVVLEYLWHAEHGLVLLWLIVVLAAGVAWGRRSLARRARHWLGAIAVVVIGLLAFSDVFERFVVYGRLVRQVVPFLCLLTGWGLERAVAAKPGRAWSVAIVVALAVVALPNFVVPLQQEFPLGFELRARAEARAVQQRAFGVFAVQNTRHLWAKASEQIPAGAKVILRASHPLQYAPYLYEGFPAEQRRKIQADDAAAMRLIDLAPRFLESELVQRIHREGRLVPLRLDLRLPPPIPGRAQPLITWGTPGKGDFLFVRDVTADQITIGFDHWGGGMAESLPVRIDRAAELRVVVSCPVFAHGTNGGVEENELAEELSRVLLVLVNGETVLCQPVMTHRASRSDTMIGWNFIGGSTTATQFTGEIVRIAPEPAEQFAPKLPFLAIRALRRDDPAWGGAPGPVEITLEVPTSSTAQRSPQPLVASGRGGESDLLFCAVDENGHLRFSLWHGGVVRHAPETLPVKPGERLDLRISLGSFWPGTGGPLYRENMAREMFRRRLRVFVNSRNVWDERLEFFPAQGEWSMGGHSIPDVPVPPRATWNWLDSRAWRQTGETGDRVRFEEHPGALRMRLLLPAGREGMSEPLITTGVTGGGDFLFLLYETGNKFRIGFDHWGAGGPLSESIPYDPDVPLELVVSLGSLHAPRSTVWSNHLWVTVDGRTVFDHRTEFHPSTPDQIRIGRNTLGGSSAGPEFFGEILFQQPVGADELAGFSAKAPQASRSSPPMNSSPSVVQPSNAVQ